MTPLPTDDELDALLARTRRETGGDPPPGLRELIRSASFERRAELATRVFAFVALSLCVLVFATVVTPVVGMTVATLWWLLPIVGFGWVALRTDP